MRTIPLPDTIRAAGRLIAFVALVWLSLTSLGHAHASLTGTMPRDGAVTETAPAQLSLSFSEPVAPLTLTLIQPDGSALALDRFVVRDRTVEIATPPDLSDGTHVLTWRVVSQDGHPVGGSILFSIGAPSAALPPLSEPVDQTVRAGVWLSKVALYLGLCFGIGGAFAIAWLVPRSRSGQGVALMAILVGMIGTALSAGFQGLDALGAPVSRFVDPIIWRAGLETSHGHTVAALTVALFCGLFALLAQDARPARLLSLAGVVGGAAALALSGHASAAPPQWLTRLAVLLHAATITVWVGALPPLGLALRANAADCGAALRRFSAAIPYAVVVLAGAGIALAAIQVEHPGALIDTAYGRLLLAKLALLAILFGLAAWNRWRLTDAALTHPFARRRLAGSTGFETLVVVVILGVAAGWRFTPPPRSLAIAAAQPAHVHIHTAAAMADVTVAPGRAGPVSVSAVLMTGDFGAVDAREVTFVFSNPAAGIEAFRRKAEKPGDGTWRADDVVLPLAGRWILRVDILVSDYDLTRIEGEIELRP